MNCSEDITNLIDLDTKKIRLILDRTGQFDQNGEGLNICDPHLKALTTNFKKNARCMSENHDENDRRLTGKDFDNAHTISPELSLNVQKSTGYLLPWGGYICNICRKELPSLTKKKKEQEQQEQVQEQQEQELPPSPQAGSSGTNPRSNKK